jgi:hypothetical protein
VVAEAAAWAMGKLAGDQGKAAVDMEVGA